VDTEVGARVHPQLVSEVVDARRDRAVLDHPLGRDQDAVHPVSEGPETGVRTRDRFDDEPLWQALRELPTRQRTVIVLRYYENLSEAEIAATMGISGGTVKSQAARAMTALRHRLAGNESIFRGGQ
jgi:RNA polymerase sigma factor (sigma-70 family)